MTEIVPYTSPRPEFAAEWLLDPAEIAQRIGGTDFVPQGLRDNPAAITAALLYGQEVGLGRMQSLAKIAVINGRPTLAAEAQRALILAAGHEIWFDESTMSRCVACGRRRGSDMVSRVTWSMDDAKRAGLAGRQAWKLYPRQMLLARASAELARAVFPDVIGGLYATEELEDSPELATAANGTPPPAEEPKPKTQRRKRVGIQAGADAPAPGPTPDEQPKADEPLATDAYKRRIFATMRELGIGQDGSEEEKRTERLAYVSRVVGRKVASSNELTLGEASALIDQLEADKKARAAGDKDDSAAAQSRLTELFEQKGVGEQAEQVSYARCVVDRELTTLADLTVEERSTLIAHVEQYDKDDPQTWPFPEGF